LGAHLDQLSARDSELLYQVCLEWLNQPNPLMRVLEGERQLAKQKLAEYRQQGSSALNEEPAGASDQERALGAELKSLRTTSPAAYDTMLRAAEKQIDALFDRQLAELTKPVQERPLEGGASDKGLAEKIAASLMPPLSSVVSLYQREEAQVRLLACHSAILRYRWEQDRLPAALSVLNLGSLASDPFTGLPLHYGIRGRTYRLAGAGSPTDPDDPRAVNGRRPVSIVPEE
jgi:hypothetical protein